jgi:hypothetical protein
VEEGAHQGTGLVPAGSGYIRMLDGQAALLGLEQGAVAGQYQERTVQAVGE